VNQEKITHRKIFQDDYGPALNWYRAAIQNVNAVDEEDGRLDPQLTVPVLMITASNDPTGGPKFAEHVKNFAADLTEQQINAGHWVQLEKKAETNEAIAKVSELRRLRYGFHMPTSIYGKTKTKLLRVPSN
jgi:soluble epoxide hydrolase/lipid-phosphate phosphatase